MPAVLWENDADIGHRWFHQGTRNIAGGEGLFQSLNIVERDYHRCHVGIDGCPDVASPLNHFPVPIQGGKGLVNTAVVAVVHDQHFAFSRHLSGVANHGAIGISGGQRELPLGHSKPLCEHARSDGGILSGQHGGDSLGHLVGNCSDCGLRRVTHHGAGVAETQINVVDAIDARKVSALGTLYVHRPRTWPLSHPEHGNPIGHGGLRALEQRA